MIYRFCCCVAHSTRPKTRLKENLAKAPKLPLPLPPACLLSPGRKSVDGVRVNGDDDDDDVGDVDVTGYGAGEDSSCALQACADIYF